MTLHLIKLSVGIHDVDHLRRMQQARQASTGQLWHMTRMTPRRGAALLEGGSIYWVIKGHVRARQRLLGFEQVEGEDGKGRCRILLDSDLVATEWRRQRPFQGWRYLAPEDVPADLTHADAGDGLPPDLAAELRELGLL